MSLFTFNFENANVYRRYENEEAILDIAIVYSGESVPMGFSKVGSLS